MKKPFHLLIAIPCMDYMHVDFVKSLTKLQGHLQRQGIRHEVRFHAGTLVYLARNSLALQAINEGFTHILFLDSDMVFDEEIVENLAFIDKDFVCGAFQSRRRPYGSCIFKTLKPVERVKEYGVEPFKIEGCGMACTMISTEILKLVQNTYNTTFNPTEDFGEDLAFCWRALKIGAEIWCEPTVRVGHIAHVPIWPGEEPAT